ncbi:MAG: cupin domain-containing protein [Labilithrix sp.]|nr:cupin domain-containing protein [Labilithrix sp.]
MQRLLGMPVSRFLREHWQKKPLLVRGALDLRDPLTPEELAGLACEEGVESRIVRERGGARPWEVTWGPHPEARFRAMPKRGWTVLVQECNRHVPPLAHLLDRFSFIPNVRVDDVMVSYAAPGGSVGPHLDSYDVFLVQGMGQRRWRYGERPAKDVRFRRGLELRILERFAWDRDEVLGPGDMLYLPPGFAHHGVAVTPCLTYSVGFRSPSFGEMWRAFAAHAASSDPKASALLVDPPLSPASNPGVIPPGILARVRDAIRGVDLDDASIDRWFASFATRLAPGHTLEAPRRPPSAKKLFDALARGAVVSRSEEGRWAFLPGPRGALLLYVGGEEIAVAKSAAPLVEALCASRRFEGRALAALSKSAAARDLIERLFSMGALGFAPRASAR